jgi:hypothetical protein
MLRDWLSVRIFAAATRGAARLAGRSTALYGVAVFAFSGLGFAVANLLLARALPKADFGAVTLAVTLLGVGVRLAPLGTDGVVHRRRIDYGSALLLRGAATSALLALGAGALAFFYYRLAPSVGLALVAGVLLGGVNQVAAGKFQSLHRLSVSLGLIQSANLTLLLAAIAALVLGTASAALPLWVMCAGYALTSVPAWVSLLRRRAREEGPFEPCALGEALSCAGVAAAVQLLSQLERLLVPTLLSLEDMALFGVVAALVIAPFRTLHLAVSYTLLPRLSSAQGPVDRRRILAGEAAPYAALVALASAAAFVATPWLAWIILEGRYTIDAPLLVAAIAGGALRVAGGFARAVATAVCSSQELWRVNLWMWVSLGVGAGMAALCAGSGLVGVVWAVNLAWALEVAVGLGMAGRSLSLPGARSALASA